LITGGAGRLGSALSEQLVAHGYKIKVFDVPTADFTPYMDSESIEIVKGDIQNLNDLREAIKDVTSIFHLAAILPPKSEENPKLTHNINVHGTQNIVRVIKEIPRDIPLYFSSSVMVYGNTSSELPPINEDHHTHAIDIYSESKTSTHK
jgi:nucleoside-diphosphate-sugar epimerase